VRDFLLVSDCPKPSYLGTSLSAPDGEAPLCVANERALGPSWPYLIETGFTTRPSPSASLRPRFPPLKTRSGVNFRLSFCAASSEVLIDCSTELNASCQGGESGSEPSTLPVYKVILIIHKS
jgi:hypothetical protein